MGILDTPGVRLGDPEIWSVVSSRPTKLGGGAVVPVSQGATTRLSDVAPFALDAVRLVYANWQTVNGSAFTLTDSSKSWTADQWRGRVVRITADATTPASVGVRFRTSRTAVRRRSRSPSDGA